MLNGSDSTPPVATRQLWRDLCSVSLGPAQVGIRVVDIVFKNIPSMVTTMMSVTFTLLGIVILLAWPAYAVAGIILYGFGNGLRAIVRGVLPLAIFPASLYATLMGRLARPSLIA